MLFYHSLGWNLFWRFLMRKARNLLSGNAESAQQFAVVALGRAWILLENRKIRSQKNALKCRRSGEGAVRCDYRPAQPHERWAIPTIHCTLC